MPVPLHEVIKAFANTVEGQSGECVAELRDGSGRPLNLVAAMKEWAELCRESWNLQVRKDMIHDLTRKTQKR